jgi:hypothetical protein
MKALFLVLISAFVCSFTNLKAQDCENSIESGDIIIEGYYGLPFSNGNKYLYYYKGDKTHNSNHIGGKIELMITNNIGLGFDVTYSNAYKNNISVISYDVNNNIKTEYVTKNISKTRLLFRANFHDFHNKIDIYKTVGLGIKIVNKTEGYNFPYKQGDYSNAFFETNLEIPIALRLGFGFRYFISKSIALNIESGLGGPLVQAGISFKY